MGSHKTQYNKIYRKTVRLVINIFTPLINWLYSVGTYRIHCIQIQLPIPYIHNTFDIIIYSIKM